MNEKNAVRTGGNAVPYTFENDLLALRRVFAMPDIEYADISQHEHLANALKRWPLLAELAKK